MVMAVRGVYCSSICLRGSTPHTLGHHIAVTFYFLWYSLYFRLFVTHNRIIFSLVLISFCMHLNSMHNSAIFPNFQHIMLSFSASGLRKSQFMLLLSIRYGSNKTLFLFWNDIVIPISLGLFLLVRQLAHDRG